MIENKKIKKLEKINRNSAIRFKKSNLRPSRAQTGIIDRPPRIFDDTSVFMMESDLVFATKDDQFCFDVSMLNHFKYITSVEIRNDLKEKIATLLLEQKPTASISSWHTLASDVEANETPAATQWSNTLKTFGEKYQSFLQDFGSLKKEASMQKKIFLYKMKQQAASKRFFLLTVYPAFEMRYRMKKDEVKCTELCFNETFLKEAGYSLESFTSTVLSEGLPQYPILNALDIYFLPRFFPQDSPAIVATLKGVMENYMVTDTELPEQETELLMKTGYRKKITFQAQILVELSEVDMILSVVFFMKTKGLPFGTYQKQPYSPDFLDILKSNDKEKEYLLKTFYGENFQGLHSNTEKVCKIKEI